jgi:hypothetical protein
MKGLNLLSLSHATGVTIGSHYDPARQRTHRMIFAEPDRETAWNFSTFVCMRLVKIRWRMVAE